MKDNKYLMPTRNGGTFDIASLGEGTLDLDDLAEMLLSRARWAGQVKANGKYITVLDHSLIMCHAAWRYTKRSDIAYLALIHDVSEAFLGDLPSRLKKALPEYKEAENELMIGLMRELSREDLALYLEGKVQNPELDKQFKFIDDLDKFCATIEYKLYGTGDYFEKLMENGNYTRFSGEERKEIESYLVRAHEYVLNLPVYEKKAHFIDGLMNF